MRVVVHIGMHKTGSSSIQRTFSQGGNPDLYYPNWGKGNHSALFILLFEDVEKLSEYHGFKARGKKFTDTLPALREQWFEKLRKELSQAKQKTVIFSAEVISAAKFENATKRLYEFFEDWSDDISAIGYARNPQTFASSAFQQCLKGGAMKNVDMDRLRPNYRARFEKIDRIFGKDRVLLKDFSSHRLLDGDVVQDFAESTGISAPATDHLSNRANESLSLEATALLFVQRQMGQGFVAGFTGAHAANNAFISQLRTIGSKKLSFSDNLTQPSLTNIHDDILWMESRMGCQFLKPDNKAKTAISSQADLIDIALENFDAVQDLIGEKPLDNGPPDMENLAHSLEILRRRCYEKSGPSGKRTTNSSTRVKPPTIKENVIMAEENNTDGISALDAKLRKTLALVMWSIDNQGDLPEDTDERKAAYKLVAADYRRKAMNVIKRLNKKNITLTLGEEDA